MGQHTWGWASGSVAAAWGPSLVLVGREGVGDVVCWPGTLVFWWLSVDGHGHCPTPSHCAWSSHRLQVLMRGMRRNELGSFEHTQPMEGILPTGSVHDYNKSWDTCRSPGSTFPLGHLTVDGILMWGLHWCLVACRKHARLWRWTGAPDLMSSKNLMKQSISSFHDHGLEVSWE